jgi:hypothetical protein
MKNPAKTINIIRWITRIFSILTALLFLVFFIGEADFSTVNTIAFGEWVMIFFEPVLLIIGMAIAWKREMLGGIIVVASVLLFNIVSMIMSGRFGFGLDLGIFIVIGFGFMFCAFATNRLSD